MSALRVVSFVLCLLQLTHAQSKCPSPNGYFADSSRCDKYVECREGVAEDKICPDGLLFNVEAAPFRFPCDYPVEVECSSRAQPPLEKSGPSGNCIRRWGMFRVGSDAGDCGRYVNCVRGKEFSFECPIGLAWHPTSWRCDWPDNVDSCDSEKFLGFTCPAPAIVDGVPSEVDTQHRNPKDCALYFVCIAGKNPRLHGCQDRKVFNPAINTCDDPANVPGCESYYPEEEAQA